MYVTNRVKGAAYRGAVQVLRGKRGIAHGEQKIQLAD